MCELHLCFLGIIYAVSEDQLIPVLPGILRLFPGSTDSSWVYMEDES